MGNTNPSDDLRKALVRVGNVSGGTINLTMNYYTGQGHHGNCQDGDVRDKGREGRDHEDESPKATTHCMR